MSNFRKRWLALFGATALIALSMSSAMAHDPADGSDATDVSGFVVGGDQEAADETESNDETEVETQESTGSAHGECVAAVAQDKEAVGPPNDNHGGAVSEAARVTCWEDANSEEQNAEDSAAGEDESDVEADDADEAADASDEGESHGNGNGDKEDQGSED